MLVVAALVSVGTQLRAVVPVLASYIEHLAEVVSIHDLVAVDAPELLAITQLEFVRPQAITCDTSMPSDVISGRENQVTSENKTFRTVQVVACYLTCGVLWVAIRSSSANAGRPRCRVGQFWPKHKWKTILCIKRCRCQKTKSIDL